MHAVPYKDELSLNGFKVFRVTTLVHDNIAAAIFLALASVHMFRCANPECLPAVCGRAITNSFTFSSRVGSPFTAVPAAYCAM